MDPNDTAVPESVAPNPPPDGAPAPTLRPLGAVPLGQVGDTPAERGVMLEHYYADGHGRFWVAKCLGRYLGNGGAFNAPDAQRAHWSADPHDLRRRARAALRPAVVDAEGRVSRDVEPGEVLYQSDAAVPVNGQTNGKAPHAPPPGLAFDRHFSRDATDPAALFVWREVDVAIPGAGFRQAGVRVPEGWSDLAATVVANKFLWGDPALGDDPSRGGRERGVDQLVGRVTKALAVWAHEDGYLPPWDEALRFRGELYALCAGQFMAFNSPVWFNVGLAQAYGQEGGEQNWVWDAVAREAVPCRDSYRNPQGSACYIQSVDDDMGSIMALAASEAVLFKYGSGTGTDLSTLRSSRETVKGGGRASGPVSFLEGYDAFAGVIHSGGRVRRAAKMNTLKCYHPDIERFVTCKRDEDRKARALVAAGYKATMRGDRDEAYSSVKFQNVNLSVRYTDEFLRMAEAAPGDPHGRSDTFPLRAVTTGEVVGRVAPLALLDKAAECAWECGDPGAQYHDTINRWHTCPNSAPINSSNPCCLVGETKVQTSEGLIEFRKLYEMYRKGESLPLAFSYCRVTRMPALAPITKVWVAGSTTRLVEVKTKRGHVFRCTPEHRFLTYAGEWVEARNLTPGTRLRKVSITENEQRSGRRCINHRVTDDCPSGSEYLSRWLWEQINGPIGEGWEVHHANGDPTDDRVSNYELVTQEYHDHVHSAGAANPRFIDAEEASLVEVWEAVEAQPRRTHKSGPPVTVGRWNKYVETHGLKGRVPLANMRDGGRIRGMSWADFTAWVERRRAAVNDRVEQVVVVDLSEHVAVFDMEVEGTHNFAVGSEASLSPVIVHNSEFMFIDNSACNLASLRLTKFLRDDGAFDDAGFRAAVRLTITAQEVLVDRASYPTKAVAENSHGFRPLGIGYADLGGLLMSLGLAYDSDEGRALAGAVTAVMHAEALCQSARLAAVKGAFPGFGANREPMRAVVAAHRAAAAAARDRYHSHAGGRAETRRLWELAVELMGDAARLGDAHGYRNAQLSLLAPTGTIAFMMDCDTTGVEPAIQLRANKALAGGGSLTIALRCVGRALQSLGYGPAAVGEMEAYVARYGTLEDVEVGAGADVRTVRSGLEPEHLPVFDGAFPPSPGVTDDGVPYRPREGRSIRPDGHLLMMAAVQPFLSGGISKTLNMSESATTSDVRDMILRGWKLGLKSLAVYRDGSKGVQPLTTGAAKTALVPAPAPPDRAAPPPQAAPRRERLPDTRRALNHHFEIRGGGGCHDGYVTVGFYPDGRVGELFLTMAKEGSTLAGFAEAWVIAMSIGLQYGVPLEAYVHKFMGMRFEPSGFTPTESVRIARSVPDYVARWLGNEFVPGFREGHAPVVLEPVPAAEVEALERLAPAPRAGNRLSDAPVCDRCGGLTVPSGSCYTCVSCGQSLGCG